MRLRKTMTQRHGTHRRSLVVQRRIVRKVGETLRQSPHQPVRRPITTKIDGEIEHARLRRTIAVITQRTRQGRSARLLRHHAKHSNARDQVTKIRIAGDHRRPIIGDNGRVTCTPGPQLVIFDLDGTLTDSAEGIVTSFRHALTAIGADVPEGDLVSLCVGPPMHLTLTDLGLGDKADEAIAAYRADYTARGWSMNKLYDGIDTLLNDLRTAGVRLAVATSKAEPTARRILEHFCLDQHFEVIAGASLDGLRSTKSEVMAHALAQLQPLPDRVLMVGDRSHDVEGAAEHGIDTVVVGWGYGADDFLEASTAAAHVATMPALREVLGV